MFVMHIKMFDFVKLDGCDINFVEILMLFSCSDLLLHGTHDIQMRTMRTIEFQCILILSGNLKTFAAPRWLTQQSSFSSEKVPQARFFWVFGTVTVILHWQFRGFAVLFFLSNEKSPNPGQT